MRILPGPPPAAVPARVKPCCVCPTDLAGSLRHVFVTTVSCRCLVQEQDLALGGWEAQVVLRWREGCGEQAGGARAGAQAPRALPENQIIYYPK